MSYHYQAGDYAAFHPEEIIFEDNHHFSLKSNQNVDLKKGCPLIVVFSNNQCFAIGVFDTKDKGCLFD